MAEDILSQEEVDALLRGVSGEPEEAAAAVEAGGPRPYDIGRQERIVRGRMPTLELINERFARLMRVALVNFSRKTAEISTRPVRVLKYSEFIRNLAVPTSLNVVQVRPLRGSALIVFEPTLVFQIVDHLFGGNGRFHTRVEGRDFTPTEMRIVRRMLDMVFEHYAKAWEPVFEITFEYVRSEINTQFVNIAAPSEVVVATSFSIDFGSGGGDVHVCMPYAMLEPIRSIIYNTMYADQGEADQRWMALLTAQVYGAEVELTADLARTELTLRQLLALQPGDVISVDLGEQVSARVDGVPVLRCKYGVVDGRYALKVERTLGAADDN